MAPGHPRKPLQPRGGHEAGPAGGASRGRVAISRWTRGCRMPGADGWCVRSGHCCGTRKRPRRDVREMRRASSRDIQPGSFTGSRRPHPGSNSAQTSRVFRCRLTRPPFSCRAGPPREAPVASPGLSPPARGAGGAATSVRTPGRGRSGNRGQRSGRRNITRGRSPVDRPSTGPDLREFSTVFNYLCAGCGARRGVGILGPCPSPRRAFHPCLARLSTVVRNPLHPAPGPTGPARTTARTGVDRDQGATRPPAAKEPPCRSGIWSPSCSSRAARPLR